VFSFDKYILNLSIYTQQAHVPQGGSASSIPHWSQLHLLKQYPAVIKNQKNKIMSASNPNINPNKANINRKGRNRMKTNQTQPSVSSSGDLYKREARNKLML